MFEEMDNYISSKWAKGYTAGYTFCDDKKN
jgi:hypothetical protein